jgi:hypothetical protein
LEALAGAADGRVDGELLASIWATAQASSIDRPNSTSMVEVEVVFGPAPAAARAE